MKILTAIKALLSSHPTVTSRRSGGIWIGRVGQNDPRPNILLTLPEQSDDWTHQGPTGLFDAHLVVQSRSDTDQGAGLLGAAAEAALNGYIGTVNGMAIHQMRLINTAGSYDETAEVFVQTSEFRIVFRSTS